MKKSVIGYILLSVGVITLYLGSPVSQMLGRFLSIKDRNIIEIGLFINTIALVLFTGEMKRKDKEKENGFIQLGFVLSIAGIIFYLGFIIFTLFLLVFGGNEAKIL